MNHAIVSDISMPPGGWKLTVPETGMTLRSNYAGSLMGKVNAHRAANGLPAMGQAEFDDAACRESGHGAPWCTGVKNPRVPTTMDAVRRFLKTMLELAKRREFVSKEEHERRMEICRGCPAVGIEGLGCHGCISDLREVEKEVGTMPAGNVLSCSRCLCLCWPKAWLTNGTMDEAEKSDPPDYAPGCWRHDSSQPLNPNLENG